MDVPYLYPTKEDIAKTIETGEFDLVINKFKYNIVEKNLPWAARIYRRVVSMFKKEQ